MKKEKSLNFLNSKWLMVAFLAIGILFFSSSSVVAQSSVDGKIANFIELRDNFAPSSAKYDIVQEAINYLTILDVQSTANPNYLLNLMDTTGEDPLSVDKIRKTHPTILANYTAAQLAAMQSQLVEFTSGPNADPVQAQKTQWVLDANAY